MNSLRAWKRRRQWPSRGFEGNGSVARRRRSGGCGLADETLRPLQMVAAG